MALLSERSFLVRSLTTSHIYNCVKAETKDWVNSKPAPPPPHSLQPPLTASCAALNFYIVKANSSLETALDKKGWVQSNGKPRWAAIRNGALYLLPREMPDDFADDPKHRIELKVAKVAFPPATSERPFCFEVTGGVAHKKFECLVDNEAEMDGWKSALQAGQRGGHSGSAIGGSRKQTLASTFKVSGTPAVCCLVVVTSHLFLLRTSYHWSCRRSAILSRPFSRTRRRRAPKRSAFASLPSAPE